MAIHDSSGISKKSFSEASDPRRRGNAESLAAISEEDGYEDGDGQERRECQPSTVNIEVEVVNFRGVHMFIITW
jgi:hypothetical protein